MIWAVPRGLDPAHACRYRVCEAYDLTLKSYYVHLIHERAVPAELMGGVMDYELHKRATGRQRLAQHAVGVLLHKRLDGRMRLAARAERCA